MQIAVINPADADNLTKIYLIVFEKQKRQYEASSGKKMALRKPMEPEKITRFFETFINNTDDSLFVSVSRLIDNLTRLQALPNANHRTAVYFTIDLLDANNIKFPNYDINTEPARWIKDFNRFCEYSNKHYFEKDLPFISSSVGYEPVGHYKDTQKWVSEMVDVQSASWRAISGVKSLFNVLISHSLTPSSAASALTSSSDMSKSMPSGTYKPSPNPAQIAKIKASVYRAIKTTVDKPRFEQIWNRPDIQDAIKSRLRAQAIKVAIDKYKLAPLERIPGVYVSSDHAYSFGTSKDLSQFTQKWPWKWQPVIAPDGSKVWNYLLPHYTAMPLFIRGTGGSYDTVKFNKSEISFEVLRKVINILGRKFEIMDSGNDHHPVYFYNPELDIGIISAPVIRDDTANPTKRAKRHAIQRDLRAFPGWEGGQAYNPATLPAAPSAALYGPIRAAVWTTIQKQYPSLTEPRFEAIWNQVLSTGAIERLLAARKPKAPAPVAPEPEQAPAVPEVKEDFSGLSLEQLEKMVSDDPAKNNALALEMVKRPNFNRELVNRLYNGLGVSVYMGAEGGFGKGIMLKRGVTLQQYYTNEDVSYIVKQMLGINEFARIYDPTCGSGRLFSAMPNPKMLHGVEIEYDAFSIAKALYPEAQLIQDDAMLHIHEDAFDYIVANPPFTLYWEDKLRIFHNIGYNNKIVSEIAILESSVRSTKEGGYISIIMPGDVWMTKMIDKVKFIEWFKTKTEPIAKIDLPTGTYEGTTWPTSLYIFKRVPWGRWGESNIPDYPFNHKLKSYEKSEIDKMIAVFKSEAGEEYRKAMEYAASVENQPAFELKLVTVKRFDQAEYLKSAVQVMTDDVITLDSVPMKLGSFVTPPITLIPNGLHADLKANALRMRYGTRWSPSRKSYVDLFREEVAKLDLFIDERKKYDTQPLVKGLYSFDCAILHSDNFRKALDSRKEWIDFQNVPFEIWVDENQDLHWKRLYETEGYRAKYPDIWNAWVKRFEAMQEDPKYNTLIPHIKGQGNWLKYLFSFQKEDVVKIALKASTILVSEMGLGKTRTSIAAAELKGLDNNLVVCEARLIDTWREEFKQLGLGEPHIVEYDDDLEDIGKSRYTLISFEALKSDKSRPRPKSKRRRNPDEPVSNYDKKTSLQKEDETAELMESMGFEQEDVNAVFQPEVKTNPRKLAEGETTKEMEKIMALQTRPMFADNLANRFDLTIVDEAHDLQNPLTDRTQAVWRLNSKQWCFLTGTPIKNRVKGLLSLLVIGWGEETVAMPYSKAEFLEHFTQLKDVEYETVDAHGYKRKGIKEVEIPQIANPDDLRTLMAGKWLRRTKYEPGVAADRKFPKPLINIIPFKPNDAERAYGDQWYKEYVRLRKEIMAAKQELKALRESRGDDEEISQLEKELRSKTAITTTMIGKLRQVALAPQMDWLKIQDVEKEDLTALQRMITIREKYKGGITERQQYVVNQLVKRVKRGEQCYTITEYPEFNHAFLKPALEKHKIKLEVIDGSINMERRTQIIERFRKKEIDVILATIKTFDVGINIPDADYCCIINPNWNWSDMAQAYSRMIRPASKGERTVDILILDQSIEKYVRQLFEMKRFNQEYVIDYGPRPPDQEWNSWTDAVEQMFADLVSGGFNAPS